MKLNILFKNTALILGAAGALVLASCNKDNDATSALETMKNAALEDYASLVYANYNDALTDANALKTAITAFLADPSTTTQDAAKDAWLDARETYGQTEAYRFYGGPIDDADGPEGQLNAWPLDESYIDYVTGDTNSGDTNDAANIINSTGDYPTITKAILAGLNEEGGEANVATGYHAVEFLLWGQDVSTNGGGGERSYTDFEIPAGRSEVIVQPLVSNQDRRRTYLAEITDLIVDDLQSLVDEWKVGGTYRSNFLSTSDASFENIVSALGKLSKGELAGERMFVALDTQSKENEHSCFSDNTHRDIVTNALGIQNVFLGEYKDLTGAVIGGTGIYDVILLVDAELAATLKTEIAASVTLSEAIQAPFDQEFLITEGQARIQSAITSLRSQGDNLAAAAQALGFEFDPSDI